MDNIKDILQGVVGKMADRQPDQDTKVERVWLNVLEDGAAEHTKLVGVKDGELSVHVDSPAWLYQMKLKKRNILTRMKDECPDIKNIRFKIGTVK